MNQKFRKITIFVSFHPKTLNISASVSMCNNTNNLQHCKLQLPVSQRSSRSLTEVENAPMPKSLLLESWWRPEVSRKNRLWLSFGDPNRMRSSGPSGWADTPRTGTPSPSSKLGKGTTSATFVCTASSKKCILEGVLMTIFWQICYI